MDDQHFLRIAIQYAQESRSEGNHPFGAILVDAQGNILLSAKNSVNTEHDATGHAETNLMRLASKTCDRAFLRACLAAKSLPEASKRLWSSAPCLKRKPVKCMKVFGSSKRSRYYDARK